MLGVVDPAITVLVALNAVDLGGNGEGRQLFASGLNNAEAFTLDPTQLLRVASAALASERASPVSWRGAWMLPTARHICVSHVGPWCEAGNV
jgi:hypothetical protein